MRPVRGVRGAKRPRDPRRALRVEPLRELRPRLTAPRLRHIVRTRARSPRLLPECPPPEQLVRRESRLVRVDVDLVRIHAHQQLGCAVARDEASLQPHGQQRDRQLRAGQVAEQTTQLLVRAQRREAGIQLRDLRLRSIQLALQPGDGHLQPVQLRAAGIQLRHACKSALRRAQAEP